MLTQSCRLGLEQGSPAGEAESGPAVVLVDDHQIVLEGLTRALGRGGLIIVGAFLNAASVLDFLSEGGPDGGRPRVDLVVVDLRLGNDSGVGVVERLRHEHPRITVAVLTSYEDRAAASAALRAGALGFLLKDTFCGELCESLRSVAAGNLVVDSRLATAALEPAHVPFSSREVAILELVAEGLTNREIGARMHLSAYTVKDYLSRVMRRLGTGTRAETVIRAAREGWLTSRA